jgi:hemerythrin superfamily protein
MGMDAITMLKQDHKTIDTLLRQFMRAGARAWATKGDLAVRIVHELAAHTAIEEQVFYPVVRAELPEVTGEVIHDEVEHHVVRWFCAQIDATLPKDERFDARVHVMAEIVRLHIDAEEQALFPRVRAALGRERLSELVAQLAKAKAAAASGLYLEPPDLHPSEGDISALLRVF